MDDALKSMGQKIYTARKAAHMSRAELGKLVGLHETTVKRYEDGEIKSPNMQKLAAFAEVLAIDAKVLTNWWKPLIPRRPIDDFLYESVSEAVMQYPAILLEYEEEFIEQLDENRQQLLYLFSLLNDTGQEKVLDYLDDLTDNPKYKK